FRSMAYWRQGGCSEEHKHEKGVNGSILKKLIVPVPPLAEQRKIARILGAVQRAMEQQELLLQLTADFATKTFTASPEPARQLSSSIRVIRWLMSRCAVVNAASIVRPYLA